MSMRIDRVTVKPSSRWTSDFQSRDRSGRCRRLRGRLARQLPRSMPPRRWLQDLLRKKMARTRRTRWRGCTDFRNYNRSATLAGARPSAVARAEGIVGTYRLIRRPAAEKLGRFYSAGEFDIQPMIDFPRRGAELGRSCIASDAPTPRHADCCGAHPSTLTTTNPSSCSARQHAGNRSGAHAEAIELPLSPSSGAARDRVRLCPAAT